MGKTLSVVNFKIRATSTFRMSIKRFGNKHIPEMGAFDD
jgi:hypothetical protein